MCRKPAFILIITALLSVVAFNALNSAHASNINGTWLTDDGLGAVQIAQCQNMICGHIWWLRDALDENGRPLFDENHPDPLQRTRSICGLQVIGDLRRQDDGSWDAGWIYDPKNGKSYDVALSLKEANTLVVTGYKGIKILSQTQYWTRAPATLKRCKPKPM